MNQPRGHAAPPGAPSPGGRIVVVSADVGTGHDTAAAEFTRRLGDQGFQVDRVNFLDLLPRPLAEAVKGAYDLSLRRLPWGYGVLFAVTGRHSVALIRALLRPVRRRMLRRIPPDTRAVVTTFPFANQVLGPLRRTRHFAVPVVTYVTDFTVHPAWVAPGVDLYCTLHEEGRRQARAAGAEAVRVVRPLVAPRFDPPRLPDRAAARRRFGLPRDDRLALIVAGSWGLGKVATTAAEVAATGCVRPVVVCGRNGGLYHRLRGFPGHVLGWVDDMAALMRAVDVIVENAGGLTCQEALTTGLPVVTYRPIPGHGRANARILSASRFTTWVRSRDGLHPTLSALLDGTAPATVTPPPAPDAAALVMDAAAGPVPGGPPRARGVRGLLDLVGDAVAVIVTLPHAQVSGRPR